MQTQIEPRKKLSAPTAVKTLLFLIWCNPLWILKTQKRYRRLGAQERYRRLRAQERYRRFGAQEKSSAWGANTCISDSQVCGPTNTSLNHKFVGQQMHSRISSLWANMCIFDSQACGPTNAFQNLKCGFRQKMKFKHCGNMCILCVLQRASHATRC